MKHLLTKTLLLLCLAVFLSQPLAVLAADNADSDDISAIFDDTKTGSDSGSRTAQPGGIGDWLRMFASLIFVLALILLAAYLFKRYAPRSVNQGRTDAIRIVGTKMLGGRKSLMLVRVRGQTLLLGVTPQSIQCLTEIQELDGEWAQPPDEAHLETAHADAANSDVPLFNQQLDHFIDSSKSSRQ